MPTIESGLVSNLAHDLAASYGQIYRVNGWNCMSVWDGYAASAVAAGIAAPSVAAWGTTPESTLVDSLATSGWVDVGVHLLRYRYANSKTQYVGNPTGPLTLNALARASAVDGTGAIYNLSGVKKSADPKVDRIIVEMTDAGGGSWFQATVLANSAHASIAVQTRDADLRAAPLFWDEFGHDTPPFFNLLESFRGRLWGLGQPIYNNGQAAVNGATVAVSGAQTEWTSAAVGRFMILSGGTRRFIESVVNATYIKLESSHASAGTRNYKIVSEIPDVLRFSKALFPESWPARNTLRVLDGRPEKGKALKGWRQDLIIFGERNMERLVFGQDPFADGQLEPVQGERGAANRKVVVDVGGVLWSLDYKGIHRYAGNSPDHVSEAIDPLFDPGDRSHGYVDFSQRAKFHAVHYPARHQILWFVVINETPGDSTVYTEPHHAIVYDYMNESIGLFKFDLAMVASTASPGADGTAQTLLADENGRLWAFGIGNTDGVHSDSATSFIVASGTDSSNIVASNSVLYASGDGLGGAFAYWVRGAQGVVIQSNSALGLTVSGGFSSAPSVGDTITLGRIPSKWKSKAFFFGAPYNRRSGGRYLHLYYEPQSSGEIRVRFYLDRSATAYDKWDAAYSSGGVAVAAGNDYFTVDLTTATGYARIPMPSDGSATIEFEIEIVDSGTNFEMTGFDLDGYAQEEDTEL